MKNSYKVEPLWKMPNMWWWQNEMTTSHRDNINKSKQKLPRNGEEDWKEAFVDYKN